MRLKLLLKAALSQPDCKTHCMVCVVSAASDTAFGRGRTGALFPDMWHEADSADIPQGYI